MSMYREEYVNGKWVTRKEEESPYRRELMGEFVSDAGQAPPILKTTQYGGKPFTYDDLKAGADRMFRSGGIMAPIVPEYVIRKPPAPPVDLRPTRGYIQHLSLIPDGERWPVLTFRVIGEHSDYRNYGALLTLDGRWRWFEGYAHAVPDECQFSQGQLGDALSAAGVAPGLPFMRHDHAPPLTAIEYVEVVTRPATATEEWKPRAPKWRGGKPWR